MYTVDVNGTKQAINEKFSYNAPAHPTIKKDDDDTPASSEKSNKLKNLLKMAGVLLFYVIVAYVVYVLWMKFKQNKGTKAAFGIRKRQHFGFTF